LNKLAIVGSHPETRKAAPFDDPGFDIWVFNEAAQADWVKRWDACFQLHKPEVYMSPNNFVDKNHWPWLQQEHGKRVIWMQEYDEFVPNSRGYPLDAIIECLPGARVWLEQNGEIVPTTWADSTPSFALMLALYQGYREIHTWGVELSSNTEYFRQLPNWVYWCGVAAGLGVKVVHHSGQKHFTSPLYGYHGEVQLDKAYFQGRYKLLTSTYNKAEREMRKVKDRIDAAMLDGKPEKVAEYTMQLRGLATEAGQYSGAVAEAEKCAGRFDPIPRQEMERRAAQAQRDGEKHREKMLHESGKGEYVWNVWRVTRSLDALNQLRALTGAIIQAAFDMGAMIGIYRENLEYMAELDKLTDAAGGEHTLTALGVANNGSD
jgi:hypothetical protein